MDLGMLNAYLRGYGDRLLDQQTMSVQTGYWAGYYSNSKHPKSVKSILTKMIQKHRQSEPKLKTPAPEVDVEAFLERERQFKEKLSQ